MDRRPVPLLTFGLHLDLGLEYCSNVKDLGDFATSGTAPKSTVRRGKRQSTSRNPRVGEIRGHLDGGMNAPLKPNIQVDRVLVLSTGGRRR